MTIRKRVLIIITALSLALFVLSCESADPPNGYRCRTDPATGQFHCE